METSTTLKKMISGTKIVVPTYQRAYSWDTPRKNRGRHTHTDVFLNDLEDYINSKSKSPYYFGHFLYEKKGNTFYVIDGQQRLTTIVIFLAAVYKKLKAIRILREVSKINYSKMFCLFV